MSESNLLVRWHFCVPRLLRDAAVTAVAVLAVILFPRGLAPAVQPAPPAQAEQAVPPVNKVFKRLTRCADELPETERWQLAGTIHQESERYGYDPLLTLAMIEVESMCSPTARGTGGATGLLQLQPQTARGVARRVGIPWRGSASLTSPGVNVTLGLRYLWELEQVFGDPLIGMAAYNMGPARAARLPAHRARRASYVRRVLARYEKIRADRTLDTL